MLQVPSRLAEAAGSIAADAIGSLGPVAGDAIADDFLPPASGGSPPGRQGPSARRGCRGGRRRGRTGRPGPAARRGCGAFARLGRRPRLRRRPSPRSAPPSPRSPAGPRRFGSGLPPPLPSGIVTGCGSPGGAAFAARLGLRGRRRSAVATGAGAVAGAGADSRARNGRLATSSAPVRRRTAASADTAGDTKVPTGRGRRIGAMSAARIIPPPVSTEAPGRSGRDGGLDAGGAGGGGGGPAGGIGRRGRGRRRGLVGRCRLRCRPGAVAGDAAAARASFSLGFFALQL